MATKRTLDTLKEAFDLSKRRKFDVKDDDGNVIVSLYFNALIVATHMLCQLAELEDGKKAFSPADFGNLQTELPENVLNEIELFLFGINAEATVENVKES